MEGMSRVMVSIKYVHVEYGSGSRTWATSDKKRGRGETFSILERV